ncbi:MAG TPA: multifunctional CCA tRNA nucleotidyl transferase/2'3'-cyclic phosphodiesterase/2'nucleotidase/phosphatase [Burkholderiales bacterium]|nr:multifunctional CCA tRNA nucleotidyl transferase/2'3'-cyclic phosphodiesterase/2'nucleotidase/phosphatase [Burkholderiales bacterium]
MNAYVVGGAVRDELLGLAVQDRDHVVVGSTPEEMVRLGFKPVGRDFPVFLHPQTHEEYALARTERKSGRGYRGFTIHAAPDVTLEEDLRRRDLTINAMARAADGSLIDPFGGRRDLEAGVLRHVSEAFAEDPVRILRVARFAARFDFRVAEETMALMRRMVDSGEADALVPERVWQELARGLAEPHPQRLFEVLERCGLRQRLLAQLKPLPGALERAAQAGASVPVRFAVLAWPHDPDLVRAVCKRLKAPNDAASLALLASREREALGAAAQATPDTLLQLYKRTDALRRPERFGELLEAVRLAEPGLSTAVLERGLAAARGVDAGAIAAAAASSAEVARLVDAARERAIAGAAAPDEI